VAGATSPKFERQLDGNSEYALAAVVTPQIISPFANNFSMLIARFDSDPAESFSVLNLISLIGLFVMILLAWLMSSHRGRVNWRMVAIGMAIQLLLAALLFNSQNWTFSRNQSQN
jgi:hypothetical protein